MEYSKHFVCFIDILGFKNTVLSSVSDKTLFEKIVSTLKGFQEVRDNYNRSSNRGIRIVSTDDERRVISECNLEEQSQMSFFSDSVIISFKLVNPRPDLMELYTILVDIGLLQYQLLLQGVFIRGGLTYGDLYHNKDVCFGPALIEAVQLEKDAIYPRIVIAPHIFDQDSPDFPYINIENISAQNLRYIRDIKAAKAMCENPPHYFNDVLYNFLDLGDNAAERVKQVIIEELLKPHDGYVRKKYLWFADYFNQTLRAYTSPKVAEIDSKYMA